MPDMTREEAYAQIAALAEKHALIFHAYGGVITIVHPKTQREQGVEDVCLYLVQQGPIPKSFEFPAEPRKAIKRSTQTDLFESQ